MAVDGHAPILLDQLQAVFLMAAATGRCALDGLKLKSAD